MQLTPFDATTLSMRAHSITTFSIMALCIKAYFATFSINDTRDKRPSAKQQYVNHDDCLHAERRYLLIVMLTVNVMSVIRLSVVAPTK